jgi:hypothetical protein
MAMAGYSLFIKMLSNENYEQMGTILNDLVLLVVVIFLFVVYQHNGGVLDLQKSKLKNVYFQDSFPSDIGGRMQDAPSALWWWFLGRHAQLVAGRIF